MLTLMCYICTLSVMNKLSQFKSDTGQTQEQLAKAFGVDRGHMSKLLNGKAYPSRKLMERINAETDGKVPVTSWFDDQNAGAT